MIEHTYEYYEVYESYDRDCRVIAKFTNYADALALKSTSAYFSMSTEPKQKTVRICESYDDYLALQKRTKRDAALEKLTDEEKKLLGVG